LEEACEQNYKVNLSVRFLALYSISFIRGDVLYLSQAEVDDKHAIGDSDATLGNVGAEEDTKLGALVAIEVFRVSGDAGVEQHQLHE
jgi:hypothetical protein